MISKLTGSPRAEGTSMAGSDGADLWSGEEMLPAGQVGASHARDAPGDTDSFHSHLAGMGFSGWLNAAFIEGVNLTVGHGVASWHVAPEPRHSKPRNSWTPRVMASLLSFGSTPWGTSDSLLLPKHLLPKK